MQLVDLLAEAGPDAVIDIDNALCRESLQVIGAPLMLQRLHCTTLFAIVLASACSAQAHIEALCDYCIIVLGVARFFAPQFHFLWAPGGTAPSVSKGALLANMAVTYVVKQIETDSCNYRAWQAGWASTRTWAPRARWPRTAPATLWRPRRPGWRRSSYAPRTRCACTASGARLGPGSFLVCRYAAGRSFDAEKVCNTVSHMSVLTFCRPTPKARGS